MKIPKNIGVGFIFVCIPLALILFICWLFFNLGK
jgi:hypothetical protein